MSRRSIAAILLVLALVCAGHAVALTFDSSRYAQSAAEPAGSAPTREWTETRALARRSACPEVIVDLLEAAADADGAAQSMSRAAASRLASVIRAQAIDAAVFAIVLLVLGILARRGSQTRPTQ